MPLLEKGQKIGLIASSDPITTDLNDSLNYAVSFLKKSGLHPVFGKHTLTLPKGSDRLVDPKLRAGDLNDFAADPEIKAIINLWGGYDSADLFPFLDWNLIKQKMLIGASDFTSILNAAYEKTGIKTYLWANAIWLGLKIYRKSEESFTDYFLKKKKGDNRNLFQLEEPKIVKSGKGEGILIGGNLQTFAKLSGTEFFPHTDKFILVFEDIDNPIEKILKFFTDLKTLAGLDKCQGLILGNITLKSGNYDSATSQAIQTELLKLTSEYKFPVLSLRTIGHNVPNEVLPIGGNISLNTYKNEYRESDYLPKG